VVKLESLKTLLLKPSLATGEDNMMTSVEAMRPVKGKLKMKY